MTPAVARLIEEFTRDIRAAVFAQLLDELSSFTDAPRRRPARVIRRRRRRRARAATIAPRRRVSPGGVALLDELIELVTSPLGEERIDHVVVEGASPPALRAGLGTSPFRERPVVVRIDGKPSRIALLVGAPAPGFFSVRLSRGQGRLSRSNRYSPKVHRIIAAELVRDASAREIELGHISPTGTPS